MSEFARYEAYKDSGVECLGEIPSEWSLIKSKYLWREKEQRSINGDEQLLSVSQYHGVLPNISDSRSESLIDYKNVSSDDLVINIMLAWMGGLGISNYEGVVSPAYCVYKQTKNNSSQYLGYLYRTQIYLSEFAKHSKGVVPSRWRMYTDDFGQILTLLPPILEQNKIVEFLDQKTTEIDEAIAKKQRLIELLKEQKAILINQAVTKGLNPNVPMRDSSVEWIGEIPAHWQIKKLKFLVKFYSGATPSKDNRDFWDGNISWVSPKDMKKKYISDSIDSITAQAVKKTGIKLLPIGTVLIVVRGMILAKKIPVAITTSELTINQDMKGLITNSWCDSEYLMYLLDGLHEELSTILEESGHGTKTMPTPKLANFELQIPSLDEQKAIVSAIKLFEKSFDQTIEKTNLIIKSLNELKQTLIAHAVTGKIKV